MRNSTTQAENIKVILRLDADWSSLRPHHVSVLRNGETIAYYEFASPEDARERYDRLCFLFARAHRFGKFLRFAKDATAFVVIATLVFLVWKVLG